LENDSDGLVDEGINLENLTEPERIAYQKCFDWLTVDDDSGKVPLSAEEAHQEAAKYIQKFGKKIRNEHFSLDYERDGFVSIFWAEKECRIYIAKDERAKARVPDKTLQVFVEHEIRGLLGFTHAEKMLLLEAKTIFNFNGLIEDGKSNEKSI
jgi:hypothetical protein